MVVTDSAVVEKFVALRERMAPTVARMMDRARLEDAEAWSAEVWLKAWRAFPGMIERETERLSSGRGGHNWNGWVVLLARNTIRDRKRRAEVRQRVWGQRAVRRVRVAEEASDGRACLRLVDVDEISRDAVVWGTGSLRAA